MTNNASLIFDVLANDASRVVLLFGLLLSILQLLVTDRKSNPMKFAILFTVFLSSSLAGLAMLAAISQIAFIVAVAVFICLINVLAPNLVSSSPTGDSLLEDPPKHSRNGKLLAAHRSRKAASNPTVASIKTSAILVISAAAIVLAARVLVVNSTALLSVFDAMNLTNRETVIVVSSLLAVTFATLITVLRNPSLMIDVAGTALLMIGALFVGEFFLAIDTYVTSYSGQSGI